MAQGAKAKLPIWRRLGWRLGTGFLIMAAGGILVSGLLQYRAQDEALRRSLGSLLLNIARTGALLIDGDLHQAVVAEGRQDGDGYRAIQRQLRDIQETNQLGDAVYTLIDVQGGLARFGVISNGLAPIGLEYRLARPIQPALGRVFSEGAPAYTDVYVNEHGAWITAFAPVKNGAGQTIAALDVDFRADVYLAELAAMRRRLYLHSLAAALLAVVGGVLLARHITRPVTDLAGLARRVVEGDLTARVQIRARDEIGMLGNVLHLMVDRLHVSHRSLVDVLVRVLETRDGEPGSLRRLALAAVTLGERLDLSRAQREALELGALLHDIGEIRTPEAVLGNPGPLTSEERRLLRLHPNTGVEILETVPLLTPALDVVQSHHERWDGGGYPDALRGEEIPVTARIFAVVDALDAMTRERPHRQARDLEEGLAEIRAGAGAQFDPRVAEAALSMPVERWATLLGLPGQPVPGPAPTEPAMAGSVSQG